MAGKRGGAAAASQSQKKSQQSQSQQHHQTSSSSTASTQPIWLIENRERVKELHAERVEKGKQLAAKSRSVVKKARQTLSQKSGLIFPVIRVQKQMSKMLDHRKKKSKSVKRQYNRVRPDAAVMMTGVLEYLCAEMLELAGNQTNHTKHQRITPRHLFLSVKADSELDTLLGNVQIKSSGAVPFIHPILQHRTRAEALKALRKPSSQPKEDTHTQTQSSPTKKAAQTLVKAEPQEDSDSNSSSQSEVEEQQTRSKSPSKRSHASSETPTAIAKKSRKTYEHAASSHHEQHSRHD